MDPRRNPFAPGAGIPPPPLANFAAKIDLACGLGIISKDEHNTLMVIKKLRDAFTHRRKIFSFDDPEITSILNNLQLDILI
jgi:DNA-binding MltR family transcriptional regulator